MNRSKSKCKSITAFLTAITVMVGCLPVVYGAQADEQTTKNIIAKHKAEYAELTPLINECKDKGFQLDYDEINYNILGHFVSYIEENLKKGDTVRVEHQDEMLTELYQKTKEKLTSYLDGTDQPLSAPTYVTSDISVVDKHFEATVDNCGRFERQPVFFVGTGHWAPSRKDIPILSKFGFNAIQPEFGGWDCLQKAAAVRDWTVVSNGYECENQANSEVRHTGEYSLKLSANNSANDNGYWDITQTVEVKPNTTYKYGLWAKAENAKYIWFTLDSNWAIRNGIEGTYDWKNFSYEYTTGPEQTEVTFYIIVQDKADAVWIDDAYIIEEGSDENILVNGGFERINATGEYWEPKERELKNLEKDFDLMAKYNLSGVLSTAPHYIPQVFLEEHPEIKASSKQSSFSTGTLLDHPKSKEYFETYYRHVMPILAGKPAFDSIVLMNEPVYKTNLEEYYIPLFQDEMKKKYSNITSLNMKWGTNYTAFDEVTMPTKISTTAQFYDWRVFNDEVIPNFNRRVSGIIKEYDSNVLTQTKMMQTMRSNIISRVDGSNNWEAMAPTVDINGCDGWTFYELRDDYSIRAQNMFYDYQTSIKNAPIYNTEDHILEDGKDGQEMKFIEGELEHNIATLWQGAIHGKCGSIIWLWDREERSENKRELHNTLLTERPETVAAIGKMTLDLNRLAGEVVSVIESQANVGMLYTLNNVPYASDYMSVLNTTYSKLGENGQKVQFIVESAMDKLNDIKCLIVPHVISVTDNSFNEIMKFADDGGKVIVVGGDSLSKDEYGHNRNSADVAALLNKASVVDISVDGASLNEESISKVSEKIRDVVEKEQYGNISIIDKTTGMPLTDCEYLCSEYEGKKIVNLCTYRDDDREIEIYINGEKVSRFTELISNKSYNGSIIAEAYTPMLISIDLRTDNIISEIGNVSKIEGLSYSNEEAYDGKWALHIVNKNGDGGKALSPEWEQLGIKSGKKYNVSFYYKGTINCLYVNFGNSLKFNIYNEEIYTDGGSYKDVGQKITDAGNGWKKFEASGFIAGNGSDSFMYIEPAYGDNDFYIDKISVYDVDDEKELIKNNSFEEFEKKTNEVTEPILPDISQRENIIREFGNVTKIEGVGYSSAEAYEGEWSVHVTQPSGGRGITATWGDLGINDDKTYNLSFYYKGVVDDMYIRIGASQFKFENDGIIKINGEGTAKITNTEKAGWKKLTITGAQSANGWKTNMLYTNNPNTDFYIDNLGITDSTGEEYLSNGGFEEILIRDNNIIKEFLNKDSINGLHYSKKTAYDGEWSVHIEHPAKMGISAWWEEFGIQGNKKYNLSFYYKGHIEDMFIRMGTSQFRIQNDGRNITDSTDGSTLTITPSDKAGWKKVEITGGAGGGWRTNLFYVNNMENDFYMDKLSIMDWQGNEIIKNGSFELFPEIEFSQYKITDNNGLKTVSIDIKNHYAGNDATAQLIIASFKDDSLIDVAYSPLTSIKQNGQWITLTQTFQANEDEKNVVYLWNSLEELVPLLPRKEIR